ncbi:periplasmic transglycosylase, solute binding [Sulfurimonas gotlandica GD1]|uniref:Periplasmic transglycosylase, solute binding n=1 Tax=Sulfurimonas gotlandica (strain DSM 19862 / JCM 16533 / GD1) TaxID=929558 RepID=B6BIF3_SULGG|nr:membrane-bound lytic murein transglycosylase MltF [Sulfurimonas gotlandica]EDZ63320.1 lytic transglycosylase, catalytic [Sulfurimonas gotlandica GD1]EHP30307.1 periplasmic transglycosylase, solute binding [Sulfurimonas gotlandica GD1]
MNKVDKNIKILLIVFFAFSFFIFGWISHSAYKPGNRIEKPSVLDEIKKTKILNVVLLNAPSTYYIGTDGAQGFEYELLHSYAEHLGVTLNITTANTIKEAIKFSKLPHIHITSASLAKTKARERTFNFGPSYFEVQEQVICNRGMLGSGKFPRDVESLAGLSITVGDGTSYSETIKSLQEDGFDINATLDSELSTEELLEQVASHKIDCTIADSNIYALNQRYFSGITQAFVISEREQLAWVLAENSKELAADMYSWFNGFNQSGKLAQLKDHYYSYVLFFDYYDNKMFYKRVKSRLPKYKEYFEKYGTRYGIPWTVLAAQSYQESHWNPKAKSFTGVRGLMMLTLRTAKLLGVKNRLDPEQSIKGGTRHLNQMLINVPKEVEGENRLKFALAAYNIGMGHIKDAQDLAKKMGLNQNIWSDLKQALPLLSQKRYYQKLKHGYARGSEPVRYVDSIYDYRDILQNINEDEDEDEDEEEEKK